MRKIAAALIAAGVILVGAAPAMATNDSDHEKVTICHGTHSDKNPYVLITVSAKAVDGEGKNDHTRHTAENGYPHPDIIPALSEDVDGETVYFCPATVTEGPAGPQGPAGPAGPQGPAGATGSDGVAGKDGTNGTNGVDGKNGVDGTAGVTGVVGPAGPAGPQGVVGESATTPATTAPVTAPIGELPHTGAGTMVLVALGALAGFLGLALRTAVRRNSAAKE